MVHLPSVLHRCCNPKLGIMGRTSSKPERQMSVLLLGIDGAGKSSLLARLCGEEVRTVIPTRGFSTRLLGLPGGEKMQVVDVSGRRELRTYWSTCYEGVHAVLFVIDAADWRRMEETSNELQRVLDSKPLVGVPLLVLANKQDVAGALSASEVDACLRLGAIRDRPWHCIACSALRKDRVTDGLRWVSELHFRGGKATTWQSPVPSAPTPRAAAVPGAQSQEYDNGSQPGSVVASSGTSRRRRRRAGEDALTEDAQP